MRDINDLLSRALTGQLSDREVTEVAECLMSGTEDPYDCLLILGRASAIQYRDLVESQLQVYDDPMLVRLAVQILCRYWGFGRDYRDTVVRLAHGEIWDEEEDARLMAISCCSEILPDETHPELWSYLIDVALNEKEREVVRQAAYSALALGIGASVVELPTPVRFRINEDMDQKVLNCIREHISVLSGSKHPLPLPP